MAGHGIARALLLGTILAGCTRPDDAPIPQQAPPTASAGQASSASSSAAAPSALSPTAAPTQASEPAPAAPASSAPIGSATMEPDGTIVLQLRAEGTTIATTITRSSVASTSAETRTTATACGRSC